MAIELIVTHTEFISNPKKHLDEVEKNNETLIIKSSKDKGVVMLSLNKYNSIMETVHLTSCRANADWLYESIVQM